MSTVSLPESEWLRTLAQRQPKAAELLEKSPEEQRRLGYFHTLREICQQPSTWKQTCEIMLRQMPALKASVKGIGSLILTGSGSSEYAGDCVRLVLQNELKIVTQAISGGIILANGVKGIPPERPRGERGSPRSCGTSVPRSSSQPRADRRDVRLDNLMAGGQLSLASLNAPASQRFQIIYIK